MYFSIVLFLQICLGTRRLKPKRSVKAQDPEKTVVVVIPIRVIEGSEGVGYSEIFPSPSDMELLPALPAHKHPTTGNGKLLATLFLFV